jgi:hypothetical protein
VDAIADAHAAWAAVGRPLLAGVPSPASEGGEHGR